VSRRVLADGGTEQVPDPVGQGQTSGPAQNHAGDGGSGAAGADAGADRTSQRQSNQDGYDRDGYP
jgi:hypothetical protein